MKLTIEAIAEIAHETNRVYCRAIGDDSQQSWKEAHVWQRESAVMGVLAVQERPDVEPRDMHDSWMKHKVSEGWKHGSEKDVYNKLHPCIVPYDQLPIEQRRKDRLFLAVVKSLLHGEQS